MKSNESFANSQGKSLIHTKMMLIYISEYGGEERDVC